MISFASLPETVRSPDWRLYRAIYGVSLHHHWVGDVFNLIEIASIPVMLTAIGFLWLAARPDRYSTWKIAAMGALLSAGVALAINRIISSIWFRERPFLAHHVVHPWSNVHDASFPSDHASASFAIAFAALLVARRIGGLLLGCAVLIGVGRLFIGAHYPGDIAAGVGVGLVAALLVMKAAKLLLLRLVRLVEHGTDRVTRPVWRRLT